MPVRKDAFEAIYPCDFYTPGELLESDKLYTVPEIARLLQEEPVDAELEPETESVLIDWAIPWIMHHHDELVVGEPRDERDPGYYGLRET